jgi:Glycosyl hydrolase family 65 central catalytic domain
MSGSPSVELPQARAAARAAGLNGALFPWQSGSDGRDETPTLLFNPRYSIPAPTPGGPTTLGCSGMSDSPLHTASSSTPKPAATRRFWRTRCRSDRGDRALFCQHGRVRLSGGPLRHRFGDGSRRVSRRLSRTPWVGVRNNAYTNILRAWTLCRSATLLKRLNHNDNGRTSRRLRIRPTSWITGTIVSEFLQRAG